MQLLLPARISRISKNFEDDFRPSQFEGIAQHVRHPLYQVPMQVLPRCVILNLNWLLAFKHLQMIKDGQSVPTQDILQLRNWAVNPEDAILSLEAIACLILSQEPESDLGAQI